MNIKDVKELIRLIDEKKFAEFDLEQGDFKIRVRRDSAPVIQSPDPELVAAARAVLGSHANTSSSAATDAAAASIPPAEADAHVITSPIVGTFYRAPNPTGEPFVKVGDHVIPHAPLCIIEAMKLMNEINSDVEGEVVKIYVENGQPVEYGQPLFGIRVS